MTFNPALAENAVIQIETATPGTFVNVNGIDRYSRKSGRSTTKKAIFMQSLQVKSTGPLDESVTISGIVDPADAGLLRALAVKATDSNINWQFLYDGTNGYKQLFRITDLSSDATPEGYIAFSATLEAEANAATVGTGPIF